MDISQPAMKSSVDVWECHKEEIRRLYLHEEKPLLKVREEIMKQDSNFPTCSESVWKKKVVAWGFEKYSKKTTIETAAAYYTALAPDHGSTVFISSTGKPIPLTEVHRFLRRSKTKAQKRRLKPTNSRESAHIDLSSRSERSNGIEFLRTTQGRLARIVESYQSRSDASKNDSHESHRAETREGQAKVTVQRYQLHKLKEAYVFGQPLFRFTDIMTPDPVRNRFHILRSAQDCVESSWSAGLWAISDTGEIVAPTGSADLSDIPQTFVNAFLAAGRYHERHRIPLARRCLRKWVNYLLLGLHHITPEAITRFLHMISGFYRLVSKSTLCTLLDVCSSWIQQNSSSLYDGLRCLFTAIAKIPFESLPEMIEQTLDVVSASLSLKITNLLWIAHTELECITSKRLLSAIETRDLLSSHHQQILLLSRAPYSLILASLLCLRYSYYDIYSTEQTAAFMRTHMKDLRERADSTEGIFDYIMDKLCLIRVANLLEEVEVEAAMLECAKLEKTAFHSDLLPELYYMIKLIRKLCEPFATKEFLDYADDAIESLVQEMAELDIMAPSVDQNAIENDRYCEPSVKAQPSQWKSETPCTQSQGDDVERAWEEYVTNHSHDHPDSDVGRLAWRDGIDTSTRENLSLPELMDIDESREDAE